MKRLLVVLVAVAGGLPAAAAPAGPAFPADVRVVPRAALCGGLTLVAGPARSSCLHPAPDQPVPSRGPASTAATPCYGDGTTGARVQLIYGYLEGRPNRAASVVPSIRRRTVPRMQAVVAAASNGRDLGIRFQQASGCGQVDVRVVRFPAGTVEGDGGGEPEVQFGRMIDHLIGLGYDRSDRKYLVLWDWWNARSVCGLGELMPDQDGPSPANPHDGLPTAGARTDVASALGVPPVVPQYAGVWRLARGPKGVDCWETAQSRAGTQLHELFHTLGAVQHSAPHSDGGGHCTDTPSVMCAAVPKPAVPRCAVQRVQVLDCGFDDFWNPAPQPGSYLENGPNIARGPFFGPQPQDDLAGSPV